MTVLINDVQDVHKFIRFVPRLCAEKETSVNVKAINWNLFKEKREHMLQEETRQTILMAADEIRSEKSMAKPYEFIVPEKRWSELTIEQLVVLANFWGDGLANWVHQALLWAYKLSNGQTWESLCNDRDGAFANRLIIWHNGELRRVGGNRYFSSFPEAYIGKFNLGHHLRKNEKTMHTVPAFVRYRC